MTDITIESLSQIYEVRSGIRSPESVLRLALADVAVDPNALTLRLPLRFLQQLELSRSSRTFGGANPRGGSLRWYDPARLTILGRDCIVDVAEVSDEENACVGRVPMLALDLVIDPLSGRLTGNPAHGGKWVVELFAAEHPIGIRKSGHERHRSAELRWAATKKNHENAPPPPGLSRWSDDSALQERNASLRGHRLTGNPLHRGVETLELY